MEEEEEKEKEEEEEGGEKGGERGRRRRRKGGKRRRRRRRIGIGGGGGGGGRGREGLKKGEKENAGWRGMQGALIELDDRFPRRRKRKETGSDVALLSLAVCVSAGTKTTLP